MQYNREKYLEALKKQLEPNILNHSLALEVCMGGIYDYLQSQGKLLANEPSREEWEMAGFIHDVDFGGEFKEQHPHKTKEALAKYGLELPEVLDQIVKAHAPSFTGVQPVSKAQWAIYTADSLTGLIIAVAFI